MSPTTSLWSKSPDLRIYNTIMSVNSVGAGEEMPPTQNNDPAA
jgi:hypothetical protein